MEKGILISIESASSSKINVIKKVEQELKKRYNCTLIINKKFEFTGDSKLDLLNDLTNKRRIMMNAIIPAVKKGNLILIDGFVHDSIAKASYYNNIDIKSSYNLTNYMLERIVPDITFILTGLNIENGDQFRYQYGLIEMQNNTEEFGHMKEIKSDNEEDILKEIVSYINAFIFAQKIKNNN